MLEAAQDTVVAEGCGVVAQVPRRVAEANARKMKQLENYFLRDRGPEDCCCGCLVQ